MKTGLNNAMAGAAMLMAGLFSVPSAAQEADGLIEATSYAVEFYTGTAALPVVPLLDPSSAGLLDPSSLSGVLATVETLPYVSDGGLPLSALGLETLQLNLGGTAIPLAPVLGPVDALVLPIVDGLIPQNGILP